MSSVKSLRPCRRGYTLAEVMIALVLAGIFATVLFSFVNGQARFTQVQDARQEVQQNTRGALELLMSELRALPGDGINSASATQLEFRVPRIWGVLCGPVNGGAVNLVVPPEQNEGSVFPPDYSRNTRWGLALLDSTITNRAAYAATTVNDTTSYTQTDCRTVLGANLTAPAESIPPRPVRLSLTGTPVRRDNQPFAGGMGTIAYLYQTVRYDVGTSDVAPGLWLRRRLDADGAVPQPVAGPLSASDADPLTFTYLCGNNVIDASAPANRPFVTGVRIAVAMQSRPSTRNVLQVERDTVTVHLRNSGAVACP